MNKIIPILKKTIGTKEINSVNAKEIYDYLKVKTAYTTWIQRTVDKYGFIGGEDFESLSTVKPSGQTEKLFIVTIDMAKELCMISDTEKGQEIRKYFISREKELNLPLTIDQLLEQSNKILIEIREKNLILMSENEVMKPKALFADSVSQSDQSILVGQFAKLISDDNFMIGQNRLFKWLRENGYLHSSGQQYNQPMQRFKEQGLFETIERTVNNADGSVRLTITTKVTGKGQVYFTNKLKNLD